MPELFESFLANAASAEGSRSTALNPLLWMCALLFATLTGTAVKGGPEWLLILVSVLAVIGVIATLAAYFYFMVKLPDALRSEKFTLAKMAMQGVSGDSLKGFNELSENTGTVLIQAEKIGEQ